MNKLTRLALTGAMLLASLAQANPTPAAGTVPAMPENPVRVGLGQPDAKTPAQLGNLRLTDPLVQQKYLNEPDMLRFLRGTYAEACTRGLVDQTVKQIKADTKGQYTPEQRQTAAQLLDSNRVWKMTSLEMEALYGAGYLTAANYCDCVLREVADADLVNPRKGLEVIEKLSTGIQRSCEASAKDKTTNQLANRKKLGEGKK